MNIEEILQVVEANSAGIDEYHEEDLLEGYELNTYTPMGVNQIVFLDFRDSDDDPQNPIHFVKKFREDVDNIDIDEEITTNRYNKDYCNHFTYSESVTDFTNWKNDLVDLAATLEEKVGIVRKRPTVSRGTTDVVHTLRQFSREFDHEEVIIPEEPSCKFFNAGTHNIKELLQYLADMLE